MYIQVPGVNIGVGRWSWLYVHTGVATGELLGD